MTAIKQLKAKIEELQKEFLVLQFDAADQLTLLEKRFKTLEDDTQKYIDRIENAIRS